MNLQDAVCIVTGSATGIGAACAIALAGKGCRVVVNFVKSETEAKQTVAECERLGVATLLVRANVAVVEDCKRLAAAALDKWGRIDGLVNNAAVTKFATDYRQLDALDANDFHAIYAVNVIGAFQMIRAVVPAMQAQGQGAIVNISSTAALNGIGSSVAYVASKGALNSMTLSLARALAPQVRVNAVCPGFVETRWLHRGLGDDVYPKAKANYENSVPLHRTIVPQDVASAVVWLLESAAVVTGEFIKLDSGHHLGPASAPRPNR